MNNKKIIYFFKVFLLSFNIFLFYCVDPPEYDDGLLLNIPAIVNENDFFSLSLNAEDYTKSKSWDLVFNGGSTDTLYTSLIIKDYSGSINDSTSLRLYNSNNTNIFDVLINSEITSIEKIPIEYIGNPDRLELVSNNFNGLIDLQLIKQ